jgi:hypothetical protein
LLDLFWCGWCSGGFVEGEPLFEVVHDVYLVCCW